MPRLFISRLLETFFRRKWLYLLVLVPFIALGVVTILGKGETYRSAGLVSVSKDTVIGDLTAGETGDPFGGVNPATYTAQKINTLLQTDEFVAVLRRGDPELGEFMDSGAVTEETVGSTFASAVDTDLVAVTSVTDSPALSFRLANDTILGYSTWLAERNIDESEAAAEYFLKQDDQAAADEAIRTGQERAEVASQSVQIVDEPVDGVLQPRRKQDAITLVLFTALGLLVAGAALVVSTLTDRSVRYEEEIEGHLHVPVLGTVPDSRAAIKPMVL